MQLYEQHFIRVLLCKSTCCGVLLIQKIELLLRLLCPFQYFTESSMVPEPVNDVNIRRRPDMSKTGHARFAMNKDLTVTKAGKISAWKFYSNHNGSVSLQVWRATEDDKKYVNCKSGNFIFRK